MSDEPEFYNQRIARDCAERECERLTAENEDLKRRIEDLEEEAEESASRNTTLRIAVLVVILISQALFFVDAARLDHATNVLRDSLAWSQQVTAEENRVENSNLSPQDKIAALQLIAVRYGLDKKK